MVFSGVVNRTDTDLTFSSSLDHLRPKSLIPLKSEYESVFLFRYKTNKGGCIAHSADLKMLH